MNLEWFLLPQEQCPHLLDKIYTHKVSRILCGWTIWVRAIHDHAISAIMHLNRNRMARVWRSQVASRGNRRTTNFWLCPMLFVDTREIAKKKKREMSSPFYEFVLQLPTILPGESKQPIHNQKKLIIVSMKSEISQRLAFTLHLLSTSFPLRH